MTFLRGSQTSRTIGAAQSCSRSSSHMTTDEPAAGILPNREPGLRPGGEARRGHWLVGSFLGPAARLIGREPGSAGVSPAS